jgi:hypothetical protein
MHAQRIVTTLIGQKPIDEMLLDRTYVYMLEKFCAIGLYMLHMLG